MKLSEARKATSDAVGAPPTLLPCSVCKIATPAVTLGNHGARCMRCYADYCAEPVSMRAPALPAGLVLTKNDPLNAPKRLLARRAAGHALNHAQRAFLAAWDARHAQGTPQAERIGTEP